MLFYYIIQKRTEIQNKKTASKNIQHCLFILYNMKNTYFDYFFMLFIYGIINRASSDWRNIDWILEFYAIF